MLKNKKGILAFKQDSFLQEKLNKISEEKRESEIKTFVDAHCSEKVNPIRVNETFYKAVLYQQKPFLYYSKGKTKSKIYFLKVKLEKVN